MRGNHRICACRLGVSADIGDTMTPKDSDSENVFISALAKNFHVNAVHVNVSQEYIMITEDKAYRCLHEWKGDIEKRGAWIAPACLFVSLLLTFVTSDFKDTVGIPKDTWRAVFMIGIWLAGLWTIKALSATVKSKGSPSVDVLIEQLKKGAVIQKTTTESVSVKES